MQAIQIKICGLTRAADTHLAARLGADAVGFNFYPESRRFLEPEEGRQWVPDLPESLLRVGVFVNSQPVEIARIADKLALHAVQLHGDESPSDYQEILNRWPTIRAVRVAPSPATGGCPRAVQLEMDAWRDSGAAGILLDAATTGAYGGTGRTLPWSQIPNWELAQPVWLAGGLSPANVYEAVRISGLGTVDVASGVESSPGRKDPDLMAAFVEEARRGFDAIGDVAIRP